MVSRRPCVHAKWTVNRHDQMRRAMSGGFHVNELSFRGSGWTVFPRRDYPPTHLRYVYLYERPSPGCNDPLAFSQKLGSSLGPAVVETAEYKSGLRQHCLTCLRPLIDEAVGPGCGHRRRTLRLSPYHVANIARFMVERRDEVACTPPRDADNGTTQSRGPTDLMFRSPVKDIAQQ